MLSFALLNRGHRAPTRRAKTTRISSVPGRIDGIPAFGQVTPRESWIRGALAVPHLTTTFPTIPASKWPGIRQPYQNSPARVNCQTSGWVLPGGTWAM